MLTDKSRLAVTAWRLLWILAGNQIEIARIASRATEAIGQSDLEPYCFLHFCMKYMPRQKTEVTRKENE